MTENLANLVGCPDGPVLVEGRRRLDELGGGAEAVLRAIGPGLAWPIWTDVRVLGDLVGRGVVERVERVPADPDGAKYRVADNLLSFYLQVLDQYRAEAATGLSRKSVLALRRTMLPGIVAPRWAEVARRHVRRAIGDEAVAVGPWWDDWGRTLDVVALGRDGQVIGIGTADHTWWEIRYRFPDGREGERSWSAELLPDCAGHPAAERRWSAADVFAR